MNRKTKIPVGPFPSTRAFIEAHPHLSGPALVKLADYFGNRELTLNSVYSMRYVIARAAKAAALREERDAAR